MRRANGEAVSATAKSKVTPRRLQKARAERRHPRKCPWCHRAPNVCWILPCLELQCALDGCDNLAMAYWAKAVGVKIKNAITKELLG